MKAIVCTKYGPLDGLQYLELEKPAPKEGEVLVKVYASSVNYNNLGHVKGEPIIARMFLGLRKPKFNIPGNDIAGRVEAVGKNVSRFKAGDDVIGDIFDCGYGAYAEYVSVPEGKLSSKPASLTFEEASSIPESALVALHALRNKGNIQPGQKVLIYGASGGIGTFAVQLAKAFGAEVTGVCSTRNLDLVRSLGADHVIDYTREDFTKNGEAYNLIVTTAGYRSIFDYKNALSPGGKYVLIGGAMKGAKAMSQIYQALLIGPILSIFSDIKMGSLEIMPATQEDYQIIAEFIEAGKVKPVIDRCYPLSEAAEALSYYEERHARGKVVLSIRQ